MHKLTLSLSHTHLHKVKSDNFTGFEAKKQN